MTTFYQLKITLKGVDPIVWRRFVVPANLTLDRLHDVAQIVMGWEDNHLHHFKFKKQIFTASPPSAKEEDEAAVRLNTLLKSRGNHLSYLYDPGDSWEHDIVLEDNNYFYDRMLTPFECIEGLMACPPEDCGGPAGYMRILRAVFDPQNNEEDYEAFLEMTGLTDFNVTDVQAIVFQYEPGAINTILALYARWSRDRALPFSDECEY